MDEEPNPNTVQNHNQNFKYQKKSALKPTPRARGKFTQDREMNDPHEIFSYNPTLEQNSDRF